MAADRTITVRVPGSTSNCGAGFDTLGLALSVYNRVTLARTDGDAVVPSRPADRRAQSMVEEVAGRFFAAAGQSAFGFSYEISGDVPLARGLGSSVTVLAGVAAGLNAFCGAGWSRQQLTGLVTELEGHPDNASAGILGGFCVSRCDPSTGAYLNTVRFTVPPELSFVVVSPSLEIATKESRGALPATLPYFDAVRSINSAAYLTAAFASGDYERLSDAGGDFMHEPYRLPLIRGGAEAIAAGRAAGGLTGWLSGSGSSILCVAWRPDAPAVSRAMEAAFSQAGVAAESRLLTAENEGFQLE